MDIKFVDVDKLADEDRGGFESKGAMRTEAKLFLNNRYGKMASSTDSSFKVGFMKPDESVGFDYVDKAGFIYADTDSIHMKLGEQDDSF